MLETPYFVTPEEALRIGDVLEDTLGETWEVIDTFGTRTYRLMNPETGAWQRVSLPDLAVDGDVTEPEALSQVYRAALGPLPASRMGIVGNCSSTSDFLSTTLF